MIKLIDILREVGEVNKGMVYPWELKDVTDEAISYKFQTDKHNHVYAVSFLKVEDEKDPSFNSYDLIFTPIGTKGIDTKEGVMLRIMATVTDITRDFVEEYKPDEISIHPITRSSEDDPKRSRIYGIYLKKNLPKDYNLMQTGESYRVIKK